MKRFLFLLILLIPTVFFAEECQTCFPGWDVSFVSPSRVNLSIPGRNVFAENVIDPRTSPVKAYASTRQLLLVSGEKVIQLYSIDKNGYISFVSEMEVPSKWIYAKKVYFMGDKILLVLYNNSSVLLDYRNGLKIVED